MAKYTRSDYESEYGIPVTEYDSKYQNLSKEQLIRRLEDADKGRRNLSRILGLLYFALMIFLYRKEIISVLSRIPAVEGLNA